MGVQRSRQGATIRYRSRALGTSLVGDAVGCSLRFGWVGLQRSRARCNIWKWRWGRLPCTTSLLLLLPSAKSGGVPSHSRRLLPPPLGSAFSRHPCLWIDTVKSFFPLIAQSVAAAAAPTTYSELRSSLESLLAEAGKFTTLSEQCPSEQ